MDSISDFRNFPAYTDFSPDVPAWCVTPGEGRCIHRYFDTSPFSPSGRYIAVFRMPYEDHPPLPGDTGDIIVIDLIEGTERKVAESHAWEPQVGANINWGKDDETLVYNDLTSGEWKVFGVRLNWKTGEKAFFEHGVYHVSADGKKAVCGNIAALRRTQTGYGAAIPMEFVPRYMGLTDEDGIWVTDLDTLESKLLISIREALLRTASKELLPTLDQFENYVFHTKWNPQGTRIMFSLRRYIPENPPRLNMIWKGNMTFDVYTISADGSELYNAIDYKVWENYGHHTTWEPDGEHLSLNLAIEGGNQVKICECRYDGSGLHKMFDPPLGSGHPMVHPSRKFLTTDVYMWEPQCLPDGTSYLRLIDLQNFHETDFLRIGVTPPGDAPHKYIELRLDPHPAWDRTGRYLAFNGIYGGTRRVFVADMAKFIS